jgi:hypothetical protein
MEDVLDVYRRPYGPSRPLTCVDEQPAQPVSETRRPLPARPGAPARHDYGYRREGVANLLLVAQPLTGRHVRVTGRRTAADFAGVLRLLAEEFYPGAERLALVTDNLNTHTTACLCEAFAPDRARRIAERLEWHDTPNTGRG